MLAHVIRAHRSNKQHPIGTTQVHHSKKEEKHAGLQETSFSARRRSEREMLLMKLENFVNAPLGPKDGGEIAGVVATDKKRKVVARGDGRGAPAARHTTFKDECE